MPTEKRQHAVHKSLTLSPAALKEAEVLLATGEFASMSHLASFGILTLARQKAAQAKELEQFRKTRGT